MKLSKQEMKEMLEDAKNMKRRKAFRAMASKPPSTFEAYLKALDDLQTLRPVPFRRPIKYQTFKL